MVNPRAYKLKLSKDLSRIHPIFHISALEKYEPPLPGQPNPKPLQIVAQEGEDIYEVDHIIEEKVEDEIRLYRVRWRGFEPDEDTWEPATNISRAAMQAYRKRVPNQANQGRGRPSKKRRASITRKA